MFDTFADCLTHIVAHFERQRFVERLSLLSDRQLDDIGLRREQLDGLRLPPQGKASRYANTRRMSAAKPSLQGCG